MKTDTELEALLRATFTEREAEVIEAAGFAAPTVTRHRLRVWLPVLAAAAAVVLVTLSVVFAVRATRKNSTIHPAPTSPSPTIHKTLPPAVPTACQTTLPAAWRAALEHTQVVAGGRTAEVLSITPDGSVLALREEGVQPGDAREVVELRPGKAPTVLYAVPDPDKQTVRYGYVVGHWLAVGLANSARPAKGTIPGSSPLGLAAVVVVDLSNHHVRTLVSTSRGQGKAVNAMAAFQGRVYWDERATYASQDGTVKSYDPSSDRVATVYRGPVGYTQVSANGLGQFLGGTDTTVVPAPLPAPIASALSSYSRAHLNTDGRAYAWLLENPGVVGWWAPGQAAPRYLRLPRGTYAEDGAGAVQVAGRFLVALDGDTRHYSVIDAEAGAAARLPVAFHGVARPELYLEHDGQLAGIGFTESNGHYINGYWAEAATTVLRLDTRSLPPLRC